MLSTPSLPLLLPANHLNSGAILVRLGYTYPNLASWALAFSTADRIYPIGHN
jgi:hypothetical protein